MKIIHTADWHLGHELHGFSRFREQGAFLDWLRECIQEQEADVLIVSGDLFDSVNPPASAQNQLFDFIKQCHLKQPLLQIILLGGNHDSASRLEAPNPLFHAFGVRSIGRLPHLDGQLDWSKFIIPLLDKQGRERALLAAIPYLRQADLPSQTTRTTENSDPIVAGIRQIYSQTVAECQKRLKPNCGLILTGHCYMQGGEISQLSERRIISGGEQALPVDLFPDCVDYVALGHLHRAQRVGGRESVRYSGSPLPLSVTERDYRHGVRVICLNESGHIENQYAIKVPRTVPYLRVPDQGAALLPEVLSALKGLVLPTPEPEADFRPFLEVVVQLNGPEPGLRAQIEQALSEKAVRLAGIQAVTRGQNNALADATSCRSLDEIDPEEVFQRLHKEKYDHDPDPELSRAFAEILAEQLNPKERTA
ncbi:MAG: exonuclease SbcCD subunit D C-terminal domain-containing protein [Magnetococcales bacterium]|nr:exonuclease SbcCD subunit D C-terminal domain-containing protein [Magnetococcales bacterium]